LFLSAGQLIVMLTGGIDLSVGPLCGALVVVASFYVNDDYAMGWWVLGFVMMVLVAGGIGLVNGTLVKFARVTPVVATLVTYMALQGFSLFMRDVPGGLIADPVTSLLKVKIGPVPWPVIAGAVILVVLELASRRTMAGLCLRGTGSADQ